MPATKRRVEAASEERTARKRPHTTTSAMAVSTSADLVNQDDDVQVIVGPPAVEPTVLPPSENEHLKALALLQGDFDNLRHSLTCKICEKLFYEPFVLSCGHTYCFRCLSSWFKASHRPTCPNCRVRIEQLPAPSYVIKELVGTIVARAELLPDGETVEEHAVWRQQEADFYSAERLNTQGLFRGLFRQKRRTVHDASDGVTRCPSCNWEIEDGRCNHCGMAFDSDGLSTTTNGISDASDSSDAHRLPISGSSDSDFDREDDLDAAIDDDDANWLAAEAMSDSSDSIPPEIMRLIRRNDRQLDGMDTHLHRPLPPGGNVHHDPMLAAINAARRARGQPPLPPGTTFTPAQRESLHAARRHAHAQRPSRPFIASGATGIRAPATAVPMTTNSTSWWDRLPPPPWRPPVVVISEDEFSDEYDDEEDEDEGSMEGFIVDDDEERSGQSAVTIASGSESEGVGRSDSDGAVRAPASTMPWRQRAQWTVESESSSGESSEDDEGLSGNADGDEDSDDEASSSSLGSEDSSGSDEPPRASGRARRGRVA